jgi:hypothetical protein
VKRAFRDGLLAANENQSVLSIHMPIPSVDKKSKDYLKFSSKLENLMKQ